MSELHNRVKLTVETEFTKLVNELQEFPIDTQIVIAARLDRKLLDHVMNLKEIEIEMIMLQNEVDYNQIRANNREWKQLFEDIEGMIE